jgi:nucleoside-diphosphate-sugar epimerase
MKALVTGASGFIGSHVTRALINAGHDVLALTTPDDNLWRIRDILPHFEIVRGTLENISSIRQQLRTWRPQACIHLAWYAEPGKYLSSRENLVSLQGSLELLQILSECNCEQFVGAGSCAEYEMKSEILSETDKTKPETLYAASKLSFQVLGEQIAAQSDLRFAWGRIFYLYGPQEDPRRIVPSAILKLQKGERFSASPGDQIRDYLHVSDVATALLALMEEETTGVQNICSGEPITIRDLLDLIGELTGRQELLAHGALPFREWEPMFICGNNDRLKATGWRPTIDLRSGLNDTIQWWKQILEKQ